MSEKLKQDFEMQRPRADAFLKEFLHQFSALVSRADISLGVPIEGRVKGWPSISEKLKRKELTISSCRELNDLIGVRVITLFRRDVEVLCKIIGKTFQVHSKEDKEEILELNSFGYLSHHFVVSVPRSWKKTPAFADLDFRVEIQVRTMAQHIWAAASHLLQYKRESDVPSKVGRSIHRVAALLETVDLEFERVLAQRAEYAKSTNAVAKDSVLDSDNLRLVLDEQLPPSNREENEPYSELLGDLAILKVTAVGDLKALIGKHLEATLKDDAERVSEEKSGKKKSEDADVNRLERGVYFTHAGLVRMILRREFGEKGDAALSKRWKALESPKEGAK